MQTRRIVAAMAAAGMIAAVAVPTVAAKSNNRLPVAVSTASFSGEADVFAGVLGVDPAMDATFGGSFTKGNESANGSYETTVVNFTLPAGVTIDPADVEITANTCRELSEDVVTVTDNVVHFALGCDWNSETFGEGFTWTATGTSTIALEGTYPVNVELKISWMNRNKYVTNMWQARTVGMFDVVTPEEPA